MSKCAVVNPEGSVVNVIVADAAFDTVQGHTLVALPENSEVGAGYVWDGKSFNLGAELAFTRTIDAAIQSARNRGVSNLRKHGSALKCAHRSKRQTSRHPRCRGARNTGIC